MEVASNGALALTILLAMAAAFPVSFALIWLYRRAVSKSMNARANINYREPDPFDTPISQPDPAPPRITVFNRASSPPEAKSLYRTMQLARWRTASIYALAGFCYAFTLSLISHASEEAFSVPTLILMTVIYAFPIVLTLNIVTAASRGEKLITAAIYFFILALVSVFTVIVNSKLSLQMIFISFIYSNIPFAILLQAFLMRKIRAVGPLVLIFMCLAVLGSQIAISAASSDDRVLRLLVEAGTLLGIGSTMVLVGIVILGAVVFAPIGWLTLRRIGKRYKGKKISDQSIIIDSIWLFFSVANSLLLYSKGVLWALTGFLPFLVYKAFLAICLALAKTGSGGKRLLVLRVFSLGKRSSRLFGALSACWRYGGSVRLIAGPDLATSTLEPHEFLDFVSGKLSRRFIDGEETFRLRFSEMDDEADRDGRFRVNDFFCRAETWKTVLARLVRESDVVIMDLRGLSDQNKGCIFEINALINTVPLERVVFIVENEKNRRLLLQIAYASWQRINPNSPNRFSQSAELRLFQLSDANGAELRQLLRTMCAAAAQKI